jgi:hypothetical protein
MYTVAIIILVCLIIWKYYISRTTKKVYKSSEKYGFRNTANPLLGTTEGFHSFKCANFPGMCSEGFRGFGCGQISTRCSEGFAGRGFGCGSFGTRC